MNNRLIIIAQVMIALAWFFVVKRARLLATAVIALFLVLTILLSWNLGRHSAHPTSALATAPVNSAMSLDEIAKSLQHASLLYGGKSGKLPLPGVDLIKKFEGFYGSAYPDALWGWSLPTIGYGSTEKPDGSRWKEGDKITFKEASNLLEFQLEKEYLPALEKIPFWRDMNANQQGAILSFGYNVGANFFGSFGFKTITKVLKEKLWDQVPGVLKLYRNPGSIVESGLLRRRIAEGELFIQPV